MDLYNETSSKLSLKMLNMYSTSFGFSSQLFPKDTRKHIANIYGLVRIADEIVDTYMQKDSLEILNDLEKETLNALKRNYSSNPIVHAFAITAKKFNLEKNLIISFFYSMRMDLDTKTHTKTSYQKYIYGSAEVIGLMCLAVFTKGNKDFYKSLQNGAKKLGSAYQKINFLRDLSSDKNELGRIYFPDVNMEKFDNQAKKNIVEDINKDLKLADEAIKKLPSEYKRAVLLSRRYYGSLLNKISRVDAQELINNRIRINNFYKLYLMLRALIGDKYA